MYEFLDQVVAILHQLNITNATTDYGRLYIGKVIFYCTRRGKSVQIEGSDTKTCRTPQASVNHILACLPTMSKEAVPKRVQFHRATTN